MDVQLDWEFIKSQLPTGYQQLAVERGLIHPQPPQLHTKVTHIDQVLRPLLHRIGTETSLQTATSTAAMARVSIAEQEGNDAAEASHLVDLSAPALHYWERKLPGYLSELLARMSGTADTFSPARWHGYEIVITDGTTVMRPGAKGITARVLYALRLSDLSVLGCHTTDEHGTESMRIFDVRPGQLWMGDRFYANPYDIAWVVDAGADVHVRYKFNALPLYDAQGQPFDVMEHVRSLSKPEQKAEWPVEVHPKDHAPIRGRLCAVRLPETEANKARERLRREEGPDVSPRALEAAAWLILFTTAAPERMTTSEATDLYRLRWQVELEIKRDKSLGGLDKLPNFRPDTIATWLLGKLIIEQIARKVISPTVAFPPSAVGFGLFPASQRDTREAPSPQRARRRRALARDGPRLPSHPRRPASRAPARRASIR
jgi:Transposase DDE domain